MDTVPPSPDAAPSFVYVKIPVGRHESDPLHQREDLIDQALQAQGLGSVLGWGDSLGERRADGSRVPAYIRIDIHVCDLPAARVALRHLLPTLGAPAGTEIHYMRQECALQDIASATGWLLEQPLPERQRSLHPNRR